MTRFRRTPLLLTSAAVLLALPAPAHAEPGEDELDFRVLSGASHAITHALSASRDTALLGYEVSPYSSLTAGGDLTLVSFGFSGVTLRLGFFGMLQLESTRPWDPQGDGWKGMLPMADVGLWRGVIGFSAGVSLDQLARRWLGPRGAFETVLNLRHESEHSTASRDGPTDEFGQDVPNIGDFIMPDFAVRLPAGPVDIDLRVQLKVFLPASGWRSYLAGPGADVVVRWLLTDWIQPFVSVFGEYLVGGEVEVDGAAAAVPDDYLVRGLLGVIFPGRIGDVQLFTSLSVGHGKGLLAYREEFLWGGGIRLAFF